MRPGGAVPAALTTSGVIYLTDVPPRQPAVPHRPNRAPISPSPLVWLEEVEADATRVVVVEVVMMVGVVAVGVVAVGVVVVMEGEGVSGRNLFLHPTNILICSCITRVFLRPAGMELR